MSESDLERERGRGQELMRKLLQGAPRSTQPWGRRPVRSTGPTVSSARSGACTNATWRRSSARCRLLKYAPYLHYDRHLVPLSDADATLIPGLWDLKAGDADRGGAVRIVADYGRASHAWDGYVDRVEAQLDEQTRTLDLIVRVPDPFSGGVRVADDIVGSGADAGDVAGGFRGPHLLVGKFVEVKIQGPIPDEYFRVRRAALRLGDEVWAVRGGTRLTIVPERVLQRTDDECT